MYPKTLYSTRGNATVRVWTAEQAERLGSGWESRDAPAPVVTAEPEPLPDPVIEPAPVKRPRGRPRRKG